MLHPVLHPVVVRMVPVMETVREVSERETLEPPGDEDEGTSSSTTRVRARPSRMRRIPGRWGRLSPLMRLWWMRLLCVLCAAIMVSVVGVLVYRNVLSNKRQELRLKCENRVEVFKSEVDNNLGASFVILGLVVSVPDVDQKTWLAFTDQTLFLRPHVRSLIYSLRVLPDQRAAIESLYNTSFTIKNATGNYPRGPDEEYAPVVLQSAKINSFLVDLYAYPIMRHAITQARDTGNFSLSAPYLQLGSYRMASFLPYYGNIDPTTLTTESARRAQCLGYVLTVLNVEEVLRSVVSRFTDSDLDISAVAKVDANLMFNLRYNCSEDTNPCDAQFFVNVRSPRGPRKRSLPSRTGIRTSSYGAGTTTTSGAVSCEP